MHIRSRSGTITTLLSHQSLAAGGHGPRGRSAASSSTCILARTATSPAVLLVMREAEMVIFGKPR